MHRKWQFYIPVEKSESMRLSLKRKSHNSAHAGTVCGSEVTHSSRSTGWTPSSSLSKPCSCSSPSLLMCYFHRPGHSSSSSSTDSSAVRLMIPLLTPADYVISFSSFPGVSLTFCPLWSGGCFLVYFPHHWLMSKDFLHYRCFPVPGRLCHLVDVLWMNGVQILWHVFLKSYLSPENKCICMFSVHQWERECTQHCQDFY